MTWRISSATPVGSQPIAETSTTQKHPLGLIVKAVNDSDNSEGEFIYLTGVASTAAGYVVEYNDSFQTSLATVQLAVPEPFAVAMSANVGSQYGWYQISGLASVAKASATAFSAASGIGAASGLAIVVASGLIVNGAVAAAAASGASAVTTVSVVLNRPHGPSDVS